MSEASQVLKFCKAIGLTENFSSSNINARKRSSPFIVIEGLDGTGLWFVPFI